MNVRKRAAAIAMVEQMTPGTLAGFLDELGGLQVVADVGYRIRRRRGGVERYPQRNAEVRKRHAEGRSYGELAMDYGLSRSGIARIVQVGKSVRAERTCTAEHAIG
jgi:hypothetical protein